jgi:hypothetical protein
MEIQTNGAHEALTPPPWLRIRLRGFIIARRESSGTLMTTFFCCRFCVVELEPVKLADGTAALVCVDCDVIGLEHEMALGGPMRSAGLAAHARAERKS